MSVKRRYSSVGPAITHRRILVSDFDAVKVLETEVLHVSGAPERRLELWYMFQFKVHEVCHHFPCFFCTCACVDIWNAVVLLHSVPFFSSFLRSVSASNDALSLHITL